MPRPQPGGRQLSKIVGLLAIALILSLQNCQMWNLPTFHIKIRQLAQVAMSVGQSRDLAATADFNDGESLARAVAVGESLLAKANATAEPTPSRGPGEGPREGDSTPTEAATTRKPPPPTSTTAEPTSKSSSKEAATTRKPQHNASKKVVGWPKAGAAWLPGYNAFRSVSPPLESVATKRVGLEKWPWYNASKVRNTQAGLEKWPWYNASTVRSTQAKQEDEQGSGATLAVDGPSPPTKAVAVAEVNATDVGKGEEAKASKGAPIKLVRIAVWTAMIGGYDTALPYNCEEVYRPMLTLGLNVTCFYITDNASMSTKLRPLGWHTQVTCTPGGWLNNWKQRDLKLFGRGVNTEDYDFSIYHDGNYGPCPREKLFHRLVLALSVLQGNASIRMLVYAHPYRKKVAEERAAVKALCFKEQLEANAELMANYSDTARLGELAILIRRGRSDELLDRGMQRWFDTMWSTGCFRDQIAFNYAMWKEEVPYMVLPFNIRDDRPWCIKFEHTDPKKLRNASRGPTEIAEGLNTTDAMLRSQQCMPSSSTSSDDILSSSDNRTGPHNSTT